MHRPYIIEQQGLRGATVPALRHAHEMLFGPALAVIFGFLLTAGEAWTGLSTSRGAALAALALLARMAAVAAPCAVCAALDLLLLPSSVAAVFVRLLLRAGNRRNLPLAGILVLLAPSAVSAAAAAAAWATAFGLYLWVCAPWRVSARLDGRDG